VAGGKVFGLVKRARREQDQEPMHEHAEGQSGATGAPPLTVLGKGRFVQLVRRGRWEYAERVNATGAAALVAVKEDGTLILVEQPRPALDGRVIELPAGLVGDIPGQEDEEMALAAGRELVEETGYEAGRIEFLIRGPSSPGISSECLALFLATELVRVGPGGGVEHEDITVHEVALEHAEAWLQARVQDGLHIDLKIYAGLYFARNYLRSRDASR
jgi:ADP-ribose pyrophosphatase